MWKRPDGDAHTEGDEHSYSYPNPGPWGDADRHGDSKANAYA